MKFRLFDWLLERLVYLAGATVVVVVLAIFYYLAHESAYAFDRTFSYGYWFALQPPALKPDPYTGEIPKDLLADPYATLLGANPEGEDGADEKEQAVPMPAIAELQGVATFGTGAAPAGGGGFHSRDDLRTPKKPERAEVFRLYAFATPEYKEPVMKLAWEPDASFSPESSPYDFILTLKSTPAGRPVKAVLINLRSKPKGTLELPTYVAKTDSERTSGYVFELRAAPRQSAGAATVAGFLDSSWSPTGQYPRFGFLALLLGSVLMTVFAVLLAIPLGVAAAIYLSEIAPVRLREWLKPIIELLASVPTVVLGYFGLMIVAPALQKTVGQAIGMTSGRSMLTASLLLAFLLLPTIISVAEDALRAVPSNIREGAEALGFTARENVKHIVMRAAHAGVVAAAMLGFARGIGETMIIWILSGGTPMMPSLNLGATLAGPSRGVPDTIAIEMGNVEFQGVHYGHLFLLGLCLFAITLGVNLAGHHFAKRVRWR